MGTETLGRTNEFIETATIYPECEGTVVYTTHKQRDLEGSSYRIARGSVQGTADMQIATITGTFMRIVDNSSYESGAAISIAREIYEMVERADMSRKDVFGALKALHGTRNTAPRGKKMRGFTKRYERIIRILFDGFFFEWNIKKKKKNQQNNKIAKKLDAFGYAKFATNFHRDAPKMHPSFS
jgi:hypothetical protein